ncbi:hypothetical protein TSUD_291590 [Trifolium subterraneum]|uniref:Uncharacterized protein n=1 Tax=Trifolium subterraneum TaxID=3900 RepID=A0A2Z6NZN2_TRISU|nr:hypothetical protein TSUD_291590 [Trifolium subterraneum]
MISIFLFMNPVPKNNLQTLKRVENFETKHKERHDKETIHKSQNALRRNDVERKAANQKTVIDLNYEEAESHLRKSKRCQVNNSPLEMENTRIQRNKLACLLCNQNTRIQRNKLDCAKKKPRIVTNAAIESLMPSGGLIMNGQITIKCNEAAQYEWERDVTESMTRPGVPQKLQISRTVSRLALAEVTSITLEIQENGVQMIKCPANLQTAGRDQFEKAIYKEWKEYQQRSKIQTGDKILFKLDKPSLTLTINIIKK